MVIPLEIDNLEMSIANYLPEILGLIQSSKVVEIIAPTGTGKSLTLPAVLGNLGYRTMVALPTGVGVVSLRQRFRQTSEVPVGYATGPKQKYRADDLVVYMTNGYLRSLIERELAATDKIAFTGVLILDEAHLNSIDQTLIVSLWMYAYHRHKPVPTLILMSSNPASITAGGTLYVNPEPALWEWPDTVQGYKINDLFLVAEDFQYTPLFGSVQTQTREPGTDEFYDFLAQKVVQYCANQPLEVGNILVFVPGRREMDLVFRALSSLPIATSAEQLGVIRVAVSSQMTSAEMKELNDPPPPGYRKVFVATNRAESSITIPDLILVVDSMLEKRQVLTRTGGSRLETLFISKAKSRQRRGRTGRTRNGTYQMMITGEKYQTLSETTPPEIDAQPLDRIVIDLYNKGLPPEEILVAIDPLRLNQSLEAMLQFGAVTPTGEVTLMGSAMGELPLNPRNARILGVRPRGTTKAERNTRRLGTTLLGDGVNRFLSVLAVAILESWDRGLFVLPPTDNKAVLRNHKQNKYRQWRGRDDLETVMRMVIDYILEFQTAGIPETEEFDFQAVRVWCGDNAINVKYLLEIIRKILEVNRAARAYFDLAKDLPEDIDLVAAIDQIRPYIYYGYFDRTAILKTDPRLGPVYDKIRNLEGTYYNDEYQTSYRLNERVMYNTIVEDGPAVLLNINSSVTRSRKTKTEVDSIDFAVVLDEPVEEEVPLEPAESVISRAEFLERLEQTHALFVEEPPTVGLNLEQEYARWLCTEDLREYLTPLQLERWLLTLANYVLQSVGVHTGAARVSTVPKYTATVSTATDIGLQEAVSDPIFQETLLVEAPVSGKSWQQLSQRIQEYLQQVQSGDFEPAAEIAGNILTYRNFHWEVPEERLLLLLEMGPAEHLLATALRYASLASGTEQLSIPTKVYQLLDELYHVDLEGFASPWNSQLLMLGRPYGSLFLDTDAIYGSHGPFLTLELHGTVVLKPPYIPDLLQRVTTKCLTELAQKELRIFIYLPYQPAASYYQELVESPYQRLILLLKKGKHVLEDCLKNELVTIETDSALIVLSTTAEEYPDITAELFQ